MAAGTIPPATTATGPYSITIGGVTTDVTTLLLLQGSLHYSGNLGQVKQVSFQLFDMTGVNHWQTGTQITVLDDTGVVFWSGYLKDDQEELPARASVGLLHTISTFNNDWLASKVSYAVSYPANTTCGAIVADVITNALAAEGVIGTTAQPTFTRATLAYNDDGTSVASGTPRYKSGAAAGQAIWVEEGTTNLLTANQGSVETDTTGFNLIGTGTTIGKNFTNHWTGVASLQVVTNGSSASAGVGTALQAGTAGQLYTASTWIMGTVGDLLKLIIKDNTNNVTTTTNVTLVAGWQRITATLTYGVTAGTGLQLKVLNQGATSNTFYVDGLQIEAKGYATSWIDGGTSRANEVLSFPTANILRASQGSIEFYVNNLVGIKRQDGNSNRLFNIPGKFTPTYQGIIAYHSNNTATWFFGTFDDAGNATYCHLTDSSFAAGYNLLTFNWSAAVLSIAVNGVIQSTVANPYLPSALLGTAYIGSYDGLNSYANTYFDEWRCSWRPRTSAEIATAWTYTSLPIDSKATYKIPFDTSLSAATPIAAGVTLADIQTFNYVKCDAIYNDVATKSNGYWWSVDADLRLYFQPPGGVLASYNVSDNDAEFGSVTVRRSSPLYSNRFTGTGFNYLVPSATESQVGDGHKRDFTLSYAVGRAPTAITVNGIAKTIGIKQTSGSNYYYALGDPIITQDTSGTILLSTDVLAVTYIGQTVGVAQVNDLGQQAVRAARDGTTGIVETVVPMPQVASLTEAYALLNGLLSKYSIDGVQVSFSICQPGLQAGQSITLTFPEHLINGQFLIQQVAIRERGLLLMWDIMAVQGAYDGTWATWLKNLMFPSTSVSGGNQAATQTVTILINGVGTLALSGTGTITAVANTYPGATTYPNTTIYPG